MEHASEIYSRITAVTKLIKELIARDDAVVPQQLLAAFFFVHYCGRTLSQAPFWLAQSEHARRHLRRRPKSRGAFRLRRCCKCSFCTRCPAIASVTLSFSPLQTTSECNGKAT